jgi:predicted P-loop ATPase
MKEFYASLYGSIEDGSVVTTAGINDGKFKRVSHHSSIESITSAIASANDKEHDLYFGVATRNASIEGTNQTGSIDTLKSIPGLWLDVDFGSEGHKGKKYPPTREDALSFIDSLDINPSAIIESGNGFHVYFFFDESYDVSDIESRNRFSRLSSRLFSHAQSLASRKGWQIDNVSDLTRILRVPGSYNHKTNPRKPVSILRLDSAIRYSLIDLEAKLNVDSISSESLSSGRKSHQASNASNNQREQELENCEFLKHCRDNAVSLSEPHWKLSIQTLAKSKQGAEIIHEWSSSHPEYNQKKTDDHIERFRDRYAPATCSAIAKKTNNEFCSNCSMRGQIARPLDLMKQKRETSTRQPRLDEITNDLRTRPNFSGNLAWDTITKTVEVLADIDLCDLHSIRSGPLQDEALIWIEEYYCQEHGWSIHRDKLWRAVTGVALENPIMAVSESLKHLEWDGIPRIRGFFKEYVTADDEENVNEFIAIAMFNGMAQRAFEPGCKMDHMIVLEGEQGIGKSSLLRILAGDRFFAEHSAGSFDEERTAENILGKLIYEIAEVDRFRTSDLKAFVSRASDRYRAAYARRAADQPRSALLIGTTNTDDYLDDPTGNRRYLPVRCQSVNLPLIQNDRNQLLAEAVHQYNEGFRYHILLPQYEKQLTRLQSSRESHSRLTDFLEVLTTRTYREFSSEEIVAAVQKAGVNDGGMTTHAITQLIKKIFFKNGWKEKRVEIGGVKRRGYRPMQKQEESDLIMMLKDAELTPPVPADWIYLWEFDDDMEEAEFYEAS